MIKLKFKNSEHYEQVKQLRQKLNSMGYDAEDEDIERAYQMWSQKAWSVPWVNIDAHTNLYYVCKKMINDYFYESRNL